MSIYANGNVTLGDLLKHLAALPVDQPVDNGFNHPHSYRGFYADLAFEPCGATTVGEMLASAHSALGKTFTGWQGGEFKMDEYTNCWLAELGDVGVPIMRSSDGFYVLPEAK
jgi:hypothetical protein